MKLPVSEKHAWSAIWPNDQVNRRPPPDAREKRGAYAGVRLNAMLGVLLAFKRLSACVTLAYKGDIQKREWQEP